MLKRKQSMNAYQLLLITMVWSQASQKQYPKVTNNCCSTAVPSYSRLPWMPLFTTEMSALCCNGLIKFTCRWAKCTMLWRHIKDTACLPQYSAVQKCERASCLFSPIFM